jgi:hypothetical protein
MKFLILEVYVLVVVALLVTSGLSFVLYSSFTRVLSRQPLVPMIDVAATALRPITNLGVLASLAWSVGIALFVILFRPAIGLISAAFLMLITLVGMLMFFVPQWYMHVVLERTKGEILREGWLPFGQINPQVLWRVLSDERSLQHYDMLVSIGQSRTWVYDPTDLFSVGGTWLIPALTYVLQSALKLG